MNAAHNDLGFFSLLPTLGVLAQPPRSIDGCAFSFSFGSCDISQPVAAHLSIPPCHLLFL